MSCNQRTVSAWVLNLALVRAVRGKRSGDRGAGDDPDLVEALRILGLVIGD